MPVSPAFGIDGESVGSVKLTSDAAYGENSYRLKLTENLPPAFRRAVSGEVNVGRKISANGIY